MSSFEAIVARRIRSAAMAALLLALLAACSPPIRQYDIENQPMSCDEANRFAYRTAQAMGFAISEFSPATPATEGVLRGRRERQGASAGRQDIRVTITCPPTGPSLVAEEEGKWGDRLALKRGFHHAFTNIVSMTAAEKEMAERIDAGTAPPSQQRHDLQILIEPVRGQASKLDFDIDFAAAGLLPLRVTVNNHTARSYDLEPAKIRLTRADRKRERPLTPDQAAARIAGARGEDGKRLTDLSAAAVAERLRAKLLTATGVGPGDKASGYLYFPLAEYRRARVVAVEEESGEAEGFLVEF